MRYLKHTLYLASVIALLSSCEREKIDDVPSGDSIRYKVEWEVVDVPAVKSPSAVFTSEDGCDSLTALVTVSDNVTAIPSPETKGKPVTQSILSRFVVDAWVKTDNSHFIDNQLATKQSSGYYETTSQYRWYAGDPEMEFWAYSFSGLTADDSAVSGMNCITRHAGTPSTMTFSYAVPNGDATVQDDIVWANVNTCKTANNEVGFTFKHALAEVRFKVADVPNGSVKSVTLEGMASTGNCSFNGSAFTWSGQGNAKDFSHTYNQSVAHGTPSNIYDEANTGDVFMMVPQSVAGKKVKILFHFNDGNYDKELTYTLAAGSQWQAEKVYTYTLSYEQHLEITVEDTCAGLVKTSPTVTNTGDYPAWIRAVLVGNWVDSNGVILGDPWDETAGSFNNVNTAKWVKGSDGYYYYTESVDVNGSTERMFESYTAPSVPAGADHLELFVASQAIYSTEASYSAAWTNKN